MWLYAGDVVEWQPRNWESTHRCTVLPLLVFTDHVQVRFGSFGATVDASNFVRLVRRGKRHMAADTHAAAVRLNMAPEGSTYEG